MIFLPRHKKFHCRLKINWRLFKVYHINRVGRKLQEPVRFTSKCIKIPTLLGVTADLSLNSIESGTEPRMTEPRKTEPRKTERRMTEPRMTEPRMRTNLERPNLEWD
jgi:hypothetical protein